MQSNEKWCSLKVKEPVYNALALASQTTGRPIIKLADEGLTWFLRQIVPVYVAHANQARATIEQKLIRPRRKKGPLIKPKKPKSTQVDEIETVTISS